MQQPLKQGTKEKQKQKQNRKCTLSRLGALCDPPGQCAFVESVQSMPLEK